MPYVGYVASVSMIDGQCQVSKEYPGGLIAKMDVELPAVLGIQAAEQPPRYVAISKVRQAMKTAVIEEQQVEGFDLSGGPVVSRMYQPESTERAKMIEGDEEEVAARLIEIFKEQGLL
jgi:electron transfer flavoprotein beta subunit